MLDSFRQSECYADSVYLLVPYFYPKVTSFPLKKSTAEKSYIAALCKVLVLIRFQASEQTALKCILKLMNHVLESVSFEEELIKDLKQWCKYLKALEKNPEETLRPEQCSAILGNFC